MNIFSVRERTNDYKGERETHISEKNSPSKDKIGVFELLRDRKLNSQCKEVVSMRCTPLLLENLNQLSTFNLPRVYANCKEEKGSSIASISS